MDIKTAKQALLERLGVENTEFYVLMSACTRAAYVQCDEETYDDEVLLFFEEERARAKGKELAEQKIPVNPVRLESRQMLNFFTTLYTMGVNALRLDFPEGSVAIQVEDIVKKREQKDMPDGSVWIENPQLHLTALYFAQEMRKPAAPETQQHLLELQEEMGADFQKASFIFALNSDGKGTPMIKLKNELKYQPVFTDVLEFQRFNREQKFRPVVVEAKQLLKVLDKDATGVILNFAGVNLPLAVGRPGAPQGEAAVKQTQAAEGGPSTQPTED